MQEEKSSAVKIADLIREIIHSQKYESEYDKTPYEELAQKLAVEILKLTK